MRIIGLNGVGNNYPYDWPTVQWQESFRPRRMDMLWIWKVFGSVISF